MKLDELLASLETPKLIGFPGAPGLVRSNMIDKTSWRSKFGHRTDWRVYTDEEPRPWHDTYVPQDSGGVRTLALEIAACAMIVTAEFACGAILAWLVGTLR